MQSDSEVAGSLLKAIAVLAALAALYAGWKVLPLYISNSVFEGDVKSQARILGGREDLAGALQDAIYRDAQERGVPVERGEIQVEYDPSGTQVDVNYTVTADLGFIRLPLHFHPHYPHPKQTFPPAQRGLLGLIGFVLGLYWFFKGFGIFREYKVISDTPLVPIRSVAMGRVQIHGRAVGEKTLLSPVSNQTCFLYKVEIDRFQARRQGQGRWGHYLTDSGAVGFYLEDETGKVLVNARGAELDLEQSYQCQISSLDIVPLDAPWRSDSPAARPPGVPTPDSELRRYVTRVAEGINSAAFQGTDMASSLEAGSRQREGRNSGRLPGLLRGLLPLGQFDQMADNAAPGDYRLTEYCLVPDGEYDITGTCMMNRGAGNEPDRQLIAQGQNDLTFLISDKSETSLEQDLRSRAWRHTIGGGLLAIGAAAVLLEALGLLV
ncbi:MAG TPA: hypothetical protein VFZ27_14355 [Terriglobia bacterium]|nr:hypothetical protein [Terriglobia bacterium]